MKSRQELLIDIEAEVYKCVTDYAMTRQKIKLYTDGMIYGITLSQGNVEGLESMVDKIIIKAFSK